MRLYRIDISPAGGFYTPIKGDTLFGMFCWAFSERFGEPRLAELLNGYTENRPFAVLSDAFPAGYLPKPVLPFPYFKKDDDKSTEPDAQKRKQFKRRTWISADKISLPTDRMADAFEEVSFEKKTLKTANSVNPESNHASGGKYSAYMVEQTYYKADLSVYAVIDENRISLEDFRSVLEQIGQSGYGKKASSGGGKFTVNGIHSVSFSNPEWTALMTLAPCVPAPKEFDAEKSFYKVFVRFGRHGNTAARSAIPFKLPVLAMDTGAVLKPENKTAQPPLFVGTGVKGVSLIDDRTVFQGYAPVISVTAKEADK